jgi:hypothetical protein
MTLCEFMAQTCRAGSYSIETVEQFSEYEPYSVRNARIGSMREARRAGTYPATKATEHRSRMTPEKTAGSVRVVPKSKDSIHLLRVKEPIVPKATPVRVAASW